MAIITGNLLLAALLSFEDFEAKPLGAPGLAAGFGGIRSHAAYVTNAKAHSGEKSLCWSVGKEPGMKAASYVILSSKMPRTEECLKTGCIRFSYWFCPDTANAGFGTEVRANTGRPLAWRTSASGFGLACAEMKANAKKEKARVLPKEWRSLKAATLGGWHFVEVFIPVNPSERLCAKMRVTWPDGTVEEGESDYPHKPGTTDLNWTPIHDMSATDSRFFLDDLKVEYAL